MPPPVPKPLTYFGNSEKQNSFLNDQYVELSVDDHSVVTNDFQTPSYQALEFFW